MQLIAETYDILQQVAGMSNAELAATFTEWNTTELDSYLIQITADIFGKSDDKTDDGFVVDKILDKTGMKGTGRWTIQEAAERSVPAPTMAAALDARYISARKEERVVASAMLEGPAEMPSIDKAQVKEDLRQALYASKICSYAQGLCLIKAASDHHNWDVDLKECARIWKGGCIIRASLLDCIKEAYVRNPSMKNLLVDPEMASKLNSRLPSWRRVVSLAVVSGIAIPSMSNSLNYFDSYRRARLPANLTQAQRDYFGGHTYERIDMDGTFHCEWTAAHHSLADVAARKAGEV